jgi:hypothetical protein
MTDSVVAVGGPLTWYAEYGATDPGPTIMPIQA